MPGLWYKTRSWPEGYRECFICHELKPLKEFDRQSKGSRGRTSYCKPCRIPMSKAQWAAVDPRSKILQRAKRRAKIKNLEFNLSKEDIYIPEICPILGILLFPTDSKIPTNNSPSIDRINSNLGYTKDNIRIISQRANLLKNNATIGELEMVLADLRRTV